MTGESRNPRQRRLGGIPGHVPAEQSVIFSGIRSETIKWTPVADISETDKEFLIKAELPEVKKEDVKVTLQDGALTISGERKHEKKQEGENEIRVESFYGTFTRTFELPDSIDTKGIRAESKDGVLRVHVPKVAGTKTTASKIEVK